ncbi:hypothetical protein OG21DRAFT_1508697 [Imleria badia]|nr:hypothetical protein OG21DRAFT_1508697 [Imleria badia]
MPVVLSHETDSDRHPYWYAQVTHIFHVNVRYYGKNSTSHDAQRMDVLFVRWFGRDSSYPSGFSGRRLHHIGFLDEDDPDVFGFLNPDVVIRGAHLVPTFSLGEMDELLGPSFVQREEDSDEDWRAFYVNIFADHDMFMRFRGGGIQ